MERGDVTLNSTNSFLLLGVHRYVCVNFGENRSRNATLGVHPDGQAHRRKPVL